MTTNVLPILLSHLTKDESKWCLGINQCGQRSFYFAIDNINLKNDTPDYKNEFHQIIQMTLPTEE